MFIIAMLCFVAGFYSLYNTSKGIQPQKNLIIKWCQRHGKSIKPISLIILASGFYILSGLFGIGIGLTFGVILLMTCASLQIIFLPVIRGKRNTK